MLDNAGGNKCERNPQSSTEISELAWDLTVQGGVEATLVAHVPCTALGQRAGIRRGEAAERC